MSEGTEGTVASLFLAFVILGPFIYMEYQYRVKRDGTTNARKAMLLAAVVFIVGRFFETRWGFQGLLIVLVVLVAATGFVVINKFVSLKPPR